MLWPLASLLIGAVKQLIGYEGDDPGPVLFNESQTCYRVRRFQSKYANSVTAVGFARVCR